MTKWISIFSILLILFCSCSKDKTKAPEPISKKQWEKYVGKYHVYNTTGTYLFNAEIVHYSSINQYGSLVDTLVIENFADTLNMKIGFVDCTVPNYFTIPTYDSIVDYNHKSWQISRNMDDPLTVEKENEMHGDTITLFFNMTNIKHCISESVSYFNCDCKHVYVKY
jgi:hypothetical protein